MWNTHFIWISGIFPISVKVGGMRVVTHTKAHKEKPAEDEKPGEEDAAEFEEWVFHIHK